MIRERVKIRLKYLLNYGWSFVIQECLCVFYIQHEVFDGVLEGGVIELQVDAELMSRRFQLF